VGERWKLGSQVPVCTAYFRWIQWVMVIKEKDWHW